MFKPGDLVEVIKPSCSGLIACVMRVNVLGRYDECGDFHNGVEIDIPRPDGIFFPFCVFKPEDLRKIDPYDGHKKTTWDECPWKPAVTATYLWEKVKQKVAV